MWLDFLFQGCMDAAKSQRVSRPARIICFVLISLVFVIVVSGLFLLAFVIEGQSILRRIAFLLLGLGLLAYYLQFLKAVIGRKKSEKKR